MCHIMSVEEPEVAGGTGKIKIKGCGNADGTVKMAVSFATDFPKLS